MRENCAFWELPVRDPPFDRAGFKAFLHARRELKA